MKNKKQISELAKKMILWQSRKSSLAIIYNTHLSSLNNALNLLHNTVKGNPVINTIDNKLRGVFELFYEGVLEHNAVSLNRGYNARNEQRTIEFDSVFIDNEYAIEHKLEGQVDNEGWITLNVPLSSKYNVCLLVSAKESLIQIANIAKITPYLNELSSLKYGLEYEFGAMNNVHSNIYEVNESSFIIFPKSESYDIKEGEDNYFAVVGIRVLG